MSVVERLKAMADLGPVSGSDDLAGDCPICGGADSMIVNHERDLFACFGCDARGGEEELDRCLADGPPRDGWVTQDLRVAVQRYEGDLRELADE